MGVGGELFTLHKQTFAEAPESRGFSLPTSRSLLMLHQIRFNRLSRTLKAGLSVARSVGCCCGRASPPGTVNRLSGHGKSSEHHVHRTRTLEMCSGCFLLEFAESLAAAPMVVGYYYYNCYCIFYSLNHLLEG